MPLVMQATGNSVEEDSRTLKDILGRMDPSTASQVLEEVLGSMDPSVVVDLTARLGYVKEEELKKAHHAALPPALQNFEVLGKDEAVQAVINDDAFVAATAAVQADPGAAAAVEALRAQVKKLLQAYTDAIDAKGKDVALKIDLRKVMHAGNEDFLKVYNAMWAMIQKSEADGCSAYQKELDRIELLSSKESSKQPTEDAALLYQQAAQAAPIYQQAVRGALKPVKGVEVQIPKGLKKMSRIAEKVALKYNGKADQVCDINRCMIKCPSMGHVALALAALIDDPNIEIVRVKDRYFNPSEGGWTDAMLNVRIKSDPNGHVCEVQIVHEQMLTARKGLPGHDVYNCVRNAGELLGLLFPEKEQPQSKEELQEWLIEYHHKGDKLTRGHPNGWDVTKVTDMEELFNKNELRTFNEDIRKWDVSSVTNVRNMFDGAAAFTQPIGDWNTSSVESMSGMFEEAAAFNQPIPDEWKEKNALGDQ